jgi:hypothetical protein
MLSASAVYCLGVQCDQHSPHLRIPALFSLAIAQTGAKYLGRASSFLPAEYNEVLSWAELPVLPGFQSSKQKPHAGPREVSRAGRDCQHWDGIGCSLTHHLGGGPITRVTASVLLPPPPFTCPCKSHRTSRHKVSWEEKFLPSSSHTRSKRSSHSQRRRKPCFSELWGSIWSLETKFEDQLRRKDAKWIFNQGVAEIALGVDNHENIPRQENSSSQKAPPSSRHWCLLNTVPAKLACHLSNLDSSRWPLSPPTAVIAHTVL